MPGPKSVSILVVDDLRTFSADITADVTYAKDSGLAIALLRKNDYNQLWLDHDLGPNDDIRPVVKWLVANRPHIGEVFVQSMNPVGAQWIVDMLSPHYRVQRANNPFLIVR